MLQVITSEIHVDFTGFPLSLGVETDEFDCAEIHIDAAERDDGAAPQHLVFRALREDMVQLLSQALAAIE